MFHFGFGGSTKNSIVSTLFHFIVWLDFLLGLVDYLTLGAAVVHPLASRAHEVGQSSTGGTLAVTWIHFGFGQFIFKQKNIRFEKVDFHYASPPGGAGLPRPIARCPWSPALPRPRPPTPGCPEGQKMKIRLLKTIANIFFLVFHFVIYSNVPAGSRTPVRPLWLAAEPGSTIPWRAWIGCWPPPAWLLGWPGRPLPLRAPAAQEVS